MPIRVKDPEDVIVQLQVRVPWWRRAELEDIADSLGSGVTVSNVIMLALDKVYPPKRKQS